MSELLKIAERCEKAEKGDRELNGMIWCALNGKRYRGSHSAYGSDKTQVEFTEPPKRTRLVTDDKGAFIHAENYTTSLDAATDLAAGMSVNMGNDVGCWAHIWDDKPDYNGVPHEGKAATLPLALCAAALRAHAAMEESNDQR